MNEWAQCKSEWMKTVEKWVNEWILSKSYGMNTLEKGGINIPEKWLNEHPGKVSERTLWKSDLMIILIKQWNRRYQKVMKWNMSKSDLTSIVESNLMNNIRKNDATSTMEKWWNEHCQKVMESTLYESDRINISEKWLNEHSGKVI
jgi:hypothetical protein